MYVSDGVCILESACTSRKLVLAKTCYMNSKCPAGYNETGSECRACHSSCDSTLGCKVPGQRNSCYGCPSGQYLLKKLASDIGTCINATDCVTPYYRGTTTTNCYSGTIPSQPRPCCRLMREWRYVLPM